MRTLHVPNGRPYAAPDKSFVTQTEMFGARLPNTSYTGAVFDTVERLGGREYHSTDRWPCQTARARNVSAERLACAHLTRSSSISSASAALRLTRRVADRRVRPGCSCRQDRRARKYRTSAC